MAFKKWVVSAYDKELAKSIAEECDIDPFVALIAVSRGYTDALELEEFFSTEPQFSDPYMLPDMDKAVDSIKTAINDDQLIAIYGDYDCDGITSCAILYKYLTSVGAKVINYIPDRLSEGYGMRKEAIDRLYAMGVSFIITVDNGISCKEEIEYAYSLGIKVVVTDHHIPPESLPCAEAVIDPHLNTCGWDFKDICGAGVAYNLVCALNGSEPEEMLEEYGYLAAIGTIGDVMPLVSDNRSLVRFGLSTLKNEPNIGIAELLSAAGVEVSATDATRIAFTVVPRINAAGRMGDAYRALNLLITDDEETAQSLANEINDENARRQQTEKEVFLKALENIQSQNLANDRIIVVSGENWHQGILGIVASRICEIYGKPCIVLSSADGIAAGSGRSIKGFSLYDAICFASVYLQKFGGHELAAGVTLKEENIDLFRRKLNEYAAKNELCVPVLKMDCKLNPAALSVDLVESLKVFEPYGNSNEAPVFGIYSVTLDKITPVSNNKHLRLSFVRDSSVFQAMYFSVSHENFPFCVGDVLDIAVTLDINNFNNREYLSIHIKGIRATGVNDDAIIHQLSLYNSFLYGCVADYSDIIPTREELGVLYKYVLRNEVSLDFLEERFMALLGPVKTDIAINAFCQLGLITKYTKDSHQYIKVLPFEGKVDLMSCEILQKLKGVK